MVAIKHIPPQMVLTEQSEQRLLFRFQAMRWAWFTLVLAIGLGGGATLALIQGSLLLCGILTLFSLLMLYSTVFSWNASQFLEIDFAAGSAHYVERNHYRKIDRVIAFSEFSGISIFRPTSEQSTINWITRLETQDGEAFVIGHSEFGSLEYEAAKALAGRIAQGVGIELSDPGNS